MIKSLNISYNELSSLSPDQIYEKANQNYQIDVKEKEKNHRISISFYAGDS